MAASRTWTRRDVLRGGLAASVAVAAAAGGLSPRAARARRVAAGNRIRVGLAGCGIRGKYLIGNLPPAAEVVALCDCYLPRIEECRQPRGEFAEVLSEFAAGDGRRAAAFQDYRQMLDEARLDAVLIAAPDHHHVPMAVAACEAGLDVYLEKPVSLTIAGGRRIVEAARRTGRVVQVGSQQRSMLANRLGCEFLRDGGLGRITRIDMPNYPGPVACPAFDAEPVPAGLDWNQFRGPDAPLAHHRRVWVKDEFRVDGLLWRGWDYWREFSGHLMTNWGAHHVDMVQYALGTDDTGPVDIRPEPEQLTPDIDRQWLDKTPPLGSHPDAADERMRFCPVTMRYATGAELRFISGVRETVFHGERGRLTMSRNRFRVEPADLDVPSVPPEEVARWDGAGHVARPHLENWLECVASRGTPRAPLEVGHRTATICHLANLARQVGRSLRWDPRAERFLDDAEANALLDRPGQQA